MVGFDAIRLVSTTDAAVKVVGVVFDVELGRKRSCSGVAMISFWVAAWA